LQDLSIGWLDCEVDDLYIPKLLSLQSITSTLPPGMLEVTRLLAAQLPPGITAWLTSISVMAEPMQVHAVMLAVFASIIAPFGT
jgi:phosphatidate cytidylyltransferase